MKQTPNLAYFSMEFALKPEIPNFAGGLGVLATDILSSCADLGVPACGISLIYHKSDDPTKAFNPSRHFKKLPEIVHIHIEDRNVAVGVFEHEIKGLKGTVPIYFLTTNIPENKKWDRDITKHLYPIDNYTRLCQEAVLGFCGIRMLRAMGYDDFKTYHMNEGHAAFLTLELLKEADYKDESVRDKCVFTTHTPVAAGHDRFEYKLADKVLGGKLPLHIKKLSSPRNLNMSRLALSLSKKANGVSKKHKEVCERMFPGQGFLSVTNGVHHRTWVRGGMKDLFDKHLKGWVDDPSLLAKAVDLPDEDLKNAHQKNKKELVDYLNARPECFPYPKESLKEDDYFDEDTLILTFSRRFVPYKRPLLLFNDLDRLRRIGYRRLQVVYSGRCHPDDDFCNHVFEELKHLEEVLRGQIRLGVLDNRNLDNSKMLVAGSDVWLNNPEPPMEASGTSGMKAAMNGGINLSVMDGWWIEAYEQNPESGWAFGSDISGHDQIDADELYKVLEEMLDVYEKKPDQWLNHMKQAISLGATFNTHRCVEEYKEKMWN